MKDNQCIVKYVVAFNWLAGHVGYDATTLHHHFYHGVLGHIKTRVTDLGKPDTLAGLHTMAQTIDTCHWECEAEISHEQNCSGKDKSSDKSTSSNSKSRSLNNNSGVTSSSNSGTSSSITLRMAATANPVVGKDGKLLSVERQHRMDQNLCLFCSGSDHQVKDCPHSNSSAAKGRATTMVANPATAVPAATT
jgi:hypothetical protein